YGKSSDEVVLSMMAFPEIWRAMPIISVSDKALAAELGVSEKYISMLQVFDEQGNYRIIESVREAYSKMPAFRNQLDKEYINLDERVNVAFMVFGGSIFNIFPRSETETAWYPPGTITQEYSGGDSIFVKSGFQLLLQSVAGQQHAEAIQ